MAKNEWVLGQPESTHEVEEWVLGQPAVSIDGTIEAAVGNPWNYYAQMQRAG